MKYTRKAIIGELRRELSMRKRLYPKWVKAGTLTKVASSRQLDILQELIKQLENIEVIRTQENLFPIEEITSFKFSTWLRKNGYAYQGADVFVDVYASPSTEVKCHVFTDSHTRIEVYEDATGWLYNIDSDTRTKTFHVPVPIHEIIAQIHIGEGVNSSA